MPPDWLKTPYYLDLEIIGASIDVEHSAFSSAGGPITHCLGAKTLRSNSSRWGRDEWATRHALAFKIQSGRSASGRSAGGCGK